ncbi:MAG: septal ring lytic transglycosylase RlpA family protein [Salinarimonadaceae bacterium]|nr:MAG: septal ring lytic transglycosylase RlpA family protein [Salinarimonadaceae bacterium]
MLSLLRMGLAAAPLLMLAACVSPDAVAEKPAPAKSEIYAALPEGRKIQSGTASFYRHGSRTANGERFDPSGMTAAHRTLPFGSRVRVVHDRTGKSVDVRINDRGPFTGGRVIDLAQGAAHRLGMIASGVAPVSIYVIE